MSAGAGSRRFAIVATTPGNGKTTLARELAARLGVEHVELDSWVHGPGWTELPDAELITRLAPVLAADGWVIDGTYEPKLGTRVIDAADIVIWLDLPLAIWFPRLAIRTARRVILREELWNGNRESWRDAIGGRDAILPYALRAARRRHREWPLRMAAYPTIRLRSPRQVAVFLDRIAPR